MVLIVLAVRDRALDAFMQPMFVPAIGAGVRAFQDEVNRKESPMHAHPDDYDLYQIGTYDDNSGALVGTAPKQVAIGKQMLTKGG